MLKLLFLGFIFYHIFLFFSSLVLLYRINQRLTFIDKLNCSFIITLSLVYTTSFILGYLHKLELIYYLILNSTISLCFIFSKNIYFYVRKIKHDFCLILKIFLNLIKTNVWLLFLFILIGIQFTLLIRFVIYFPPEGWDSYSYHLPLSAAIFRYKGFPDIKFMSQLLHFFFPKNFELLVAVYYLFTDTIRGHQVHFEYRKTLSIIKNLFKNEKYYPVLMSENYEWGPIKGILRYLEAINFKRRIVRIEKIDHIEKFKKIIAPPINKLKGYVKIYSDKNVSVWKKE